MLSQPIFDVPSRPSVPVEGFQPQGSNTGVKIPSPTLECGIDWISGTFPQSLVDTLKAILHTFFHDEFVEQAKGTGWYRDGYRSSLGMVLGMHAYGEGRTDAYISIPGAVLAALSARKVQALMLALHEQVQFHCSRLDLKIDDYTKTVTAEKAYEAYMDKGVSGFRTHHWHSSGDIKKGIGTCLQLGSRGSKGSGKFLRIYDKFIESGGKLDCMRIELELSGNLSTNYFPFLATLPFEQFGEWIANIIISSVDFIKRPPSGRLRDSVRLDWWAFLADGRDKISLCKEVIASSVERAKRWIHNQVAPTLATIMATFNNEDEWNEFFWDAIFSGERRMQPRHNAMVNAENTRKRMKVTLKSER